MPESKVSPIGQIILPATVKKRWEGSNDQVQVADLGEGVLVIPDGTEWAILEAYYPMSNLLKVVGETLQTHDPCVAIELKHYRNDVFHAQTITEQGMINLPISVLENWKINKGGKVDTADLGSGLLLMPKDTEHRPSDIVPIGMLHAGNWQYNRYGTLTPFLMDAYARWVETLGREIAEAAFEGGKLEAIKTTRDETLLGQKIGGFVLRSALQAALATRIV